MSAIQSGAEEEEEAEETEAWVVAVLSIGKESMVLTGVVSTTSMVDYGYKIVWSRCGVYTNMKI